MHRRVLVFRCVAYEPVRVLGYPDRLLGGIVTEESTVGRDTTRRSKRHGIGRAPGLPLILTALMLLIAPAVRPAEKPDPATAAPGKAGRDTSRDASKIVALHVGIPGVAFIGQTLADLKKKFPAAEVKPFAKQIDAAVVTAADAGISCIVVGSSPDDLRVASVGFILDGTYQGSREGGYRTREGIGKGSTVNDLLERYGKPTEVTGERAANPALSMSGKPEEPKGAKKYHYASADRKIKTYFVVDASRVTRVVINDLDPLNAHLLKRPAKP
jgi:hypothetical protein